MSLTKERLFQIKRDLEKESWNIRFEIIHGDEQLTVKLGESEKFRKNTYENISGMKMRVIEKGGK